MIKNSIELKNVVFRYKVHRKMTSSKHTVLRTASLSIEKGEVLCICGRSGQGKTTVLKIIAGLEQAEKGEIFYNGVVIKNSNALRLSQEKISYVFQNSALISNMTIYENVALPLRYNGELTETQIDEKVRQVLERMLVNKRYFDSYPHTLSDGAQKRIAIARAFVTDPEILLMDEPTAGLDNVNKRSLIALIYNIQRLSRPTIVVVTHDLSLAKYLDAKITFLERGAFSKQYRYHELEQANESYIKDMLGNQNLNIDSEANN